MIDPETCSWCSEEWEYKMLWEAYDGAMICPTCKFDALDMYVSAEDQYCR